MNYERSVAVFPLVQRAVPSCFIGRSPNAPSSLSRPTDSVSQTSSRISATYVAYRMAPLPVTFSDMAYQIVAIRMTSMSFNYSKHFQM